MRSPALNECDEDQIYAYFPKVFHSHFLRLRPRTQLESQIDLRVMCHLRSFQREAHGEARIRTPLLQLNGNLSLSNTSVFPEQKKSPADLKSSTAGMSN
ncbi:hypothetical protein TNIN_180231 [Trichonephila inaurata madagascariensis]|uniref:Uncharacterized protein n=1 Tax=Trichonephila inaurata madagascariensis TaxID=2747483 RepID=A0A8X6MLR5_9ARAC|nr:hypothetical protein TNIN_180231 [Trichonephila inaurata madagascariensis]